jgi:glycerol-3-phosphate dehydrogenase/sugar (pentulose or hexulose) kinase
MMTGAQGWRDRVWSDLDQPWDLIVIGGGITGAGILREAGRARLRALLVEAHDFASGTSSRSSKMVHGGLRYLANFQIKLTAESVRERERLLREGTGLIEPLESLLTTYSGDGQPAWMLSAGLMVYDLLALQWRRQHHTAAQVRALCPSINMDRLAGAYSYHDAQTDDARLVLRVIGEAVHAGATALNYARVDGLLRDRAGQVQGIQLRDQVTGKQREVRAPVVISATGAWADQLRAHVDGKPQLRPLRGSHLFFPWHKLPLTQSINFWHPLDGRPVFAYPWEGVTLVGTTDVDQGADLPTDPRLSMGEAEYLMQAVTHAFQPLELSLRDVQSTMSGVRAVVNTGQSDPSRESREFVLWNENGLLTVTGGKLTTFRLMAQQALRAVRRKLPGRFKWSPRDRVLDPPDQPLEADLPPLVRARLLGRYGAEATDLIHAAAPDELTSIGNSPSLWAELRWAARAEGVVHLDDLLLRRVRLGIISPLGGLPLMDRIRAIAQPELGWDDQRWQSELARYAQLWKECYSVGYWSAPPPPMTRDHLLSIDNGTQSVRALIFDAQGNLIAKSRVPIEPYFSTAPGLAEQHPEVFWQAVCAACRQLWSMSGVSRDAIAGVGLTTQRGTVVNLDAAGDPLRPAILWLDQRRTEGQQPIGGMWGLAFKLSGMSSTIAYLQAEAEGNWIRTYQPEIWKQTRKYLLLSGYLTYRLTGRYADSVGCQVGYLPFDYKRKQWAAARDWKWQVMPVAPEWLPELIPPAQQLGEITRAASDATGIPYGLPLIAAAADKACEVIGSGALDPHIGCLSYGTTATINTTHRKYVEAIPLIPPYPSAVPDAYSLEIQIYRGYWMVSWFKQEFGNREQRLAEERGIAPEELFDELVRAVPAGADGLLLQPYWSPGIKVPGPEARGAIVGFSDVHTRAHIYRAILEGLAYALRDGAERTTRRSGVPITEVRVAGGGSQSRAAMQLTADIFGLPASRPHVYEASGLGAAIDVAVGLGWHPDFATAVEEMTRVGETFDPDPHAQALYDELYRNVYRKMYGRLKPLYQAIRRITGR